MMTSVSSERTRGTRDKMQISTTQPTQPQKQVVQATAEQIRFAQMIYDKNDADFEDKVKQLMEVTGKNQDECIVALHDCNGDMNRAINILLEGISDTTSWETVGGKKKSLGKEGLENKENREKRGDREMSRRWGSSNRRGRGGSRGREFKAEENGVGNNQGDRPSDRGKRGHVRGFGRGRGRGAGRFSAQGMGTFNPADYMESSATDGFGTKSDIWETGQNDADDGTGPWKNSVEEWTAEDWNEDLSETKVFTASSVPAENHVTPRQSIDLVTLFQKPEKPVTFTQETEGNSFEAPQQQTFGQALVFTNSQHSTQMASGSGSSSAVNSYSPQSLSAVLCSGFGELGSSKLTNSAGSQILDQLKSPGLGQFTSQQNNNSSTTTTTSSWDLKPPITQSSVLSQFAASWPLRSQRVLVDRPDPRNSSPSVALPSQPPLLLPPQRRRWWSVPPPAFRSAAAQPLPCRLTRPPPQPPRPPFRLARRMGPLQPGRAERPRVVSQRNYPPATLPLGRRAPQAKPQSPTPRRSPPSPGGVGAAVSGSATDPAAGHGTATPAAPCREAQDPMAAPVGNGTPAVGTMHGAAGGHTAAHVGGAPPVASAVPDPGHAPMAAAGGRGEVPEDWSLANVMPIHKKGWKEDLGNFRPISLTLMLGKVIEQIILSAIMHQIPASAVEMPGSSDVTGLNVQFGALEFGSEPALPELGSTSSSENTSQATNNSLYTKSLKYVDPLNTSLPISNTVQDSTYTTSAISSSSLTCSSQSTIPVTTSSYDQTSVHSRIAYQSSMTPSEPTPVADTNGHSSVRTQATLDTTSSIPVLKTEPSPSLPSAGSLPSMVSTTASLLPSASQHAATLCSLPQSSDLASNSLSQLSSSLSNHQSSLSPASVLSSSTSHVHTSVENTTLLQPSTTFSTASTSATSTTSSVVSMASSMNTTVSLGLSVTSVSATTRATPLVSSGKAPPNLPQGVPPLLHNQYIVGPGGLLPAYPIYGYDDLQMLQPRLPMDYYGITFPAPATLTGRDGSLVNNPYSGDITKFGRGDSASPAPTTTLAQPQQNQPQTHHTTQQPFLNPTLPPGYSYTGLPYYAGVPGVPSAFQYGPTMFVPPASAKQHGVNLNTTSTPFQQASGYGQHGYGTGYDDLTQGAAAGDYSKGGYNVSSQAQNKSAGTGPGKGVSVTSSNTGVPDINGSVYNKTQTFDKQGFHAGTPPPFSLPSGLGSTGPLNPGAAPGYAPAPFLHILPAHQQPHSQMLHHHLHQDGQGGSGQRNQPSTMQQKSQATKTTYGTSPYWTN
ncbi:ubiquitin-associated protein 2-like [Corapipo altera]|uniref:ubiquitin-associated protein 2-like n=1 Tax=Corapipo altera TaxID=415028 RepID=UPI000FD63EB5|nr:ubiquitin-associated protein 2-like [Corapipo altera]